MLSENAKNYTEKVVVNSDTGQQDHHSGGDYSHHHNHNTVSTKQHQQLPYSNNINKGSAVEVDDSLSLKENMPCAINDARTSQTTACMTRSTLTSRVSGGGE